MKVTRELIVRCVQEWEVDPVDLDGWDGEEDSLTSHDWDVTGAGDLLTESIYFDLNDDELTYTIDSGWDRANVEPWIDPDVMTA